MTDLVTFLIEGKYPTAVHRAGTNLREYKVWLYDLTKEAALRNISRGNSCVTHLRLVQVNYEVVTSGDTEDAVYDIQGKYINNSVHAGIQREWQCWMKGITFQDAHWYLKKGNSLTSELRIVKVSTQVLGEFDNNGNSLNVF